MTLSLGFSPCPNDTFIFYALVHGLVGAPAFAPPCLEDVETLNEWALAGRLDVTKLSFHAYGLVRDRYALLASGGALGRGCGPLLVQRPGQPLDLGRATVAIPGRYTTAALLLRLYAPEVGGLRCLRFDQIMPAVAAGEVDAGVIIHESRFTYQAHGLAAAVDLGAWWEESTGLPIPLGCIAARREMGEARIAEVEQAIRQSVDWAFAHPQDVLPWIRGHAQELDDAVIASHIELYVNDFSRDLGEEGQRAVAALLERGRRAGVF